MQVSAKSYSATTLCLSLVVVKIKSQMSSQQCSIDKCELDPGPNQLCHIFLQCTTENIKYAYEYGRYKINLD